MLRSVKSQITLAISAIIIAILGATTYLVIDQKTREINQDIFSKAVSFAELTHERVISGFENNYQQAAYANFERELASVYSLNEDILALSVYSYEGEDLYKDTAIANDTFKPELDRLQAVFPSVKIKNTGRIIYLEKLNEKLRYTDINGREVEPISDTEQIVNVVYPFRDPNDITRNYSVNYDVSYESLKQRVRETAIRMIIIAAAGVLIALLIGYMLANGITAPIKSLSQGAAKIGKGDLKTRIKVKSKSEVGMLANTFNAMAEDLEKSTAAMIEHEKTAKELELAGEIQRELLPTNLPKVENLDIAASLNAATQVGGDCYDFIPMESGNLLFYIADVTGHGVGAGLVSAINNALVPALMNHYSTTTEVVIELNKLLKLKTSDNVFVTLVMAIWDTERKQMQFTQAGHDPILHFKADDNTVIRLAHGGMALGMMDDVSQVIKTEEVITGIGDVFVLYTDGIPEAWKNEKESYGMERLIESVQKHSALKTAVEIHDAILKDVAEYMGEYPQADDITLLVVKRTG